MWCEDSIAMGTKGRMVPPEYLVPDSLKTPTTTASAIDKDWVRRNASSTQFTTSVLSICSSCLIIFSVMASFDLKESSPFESYSWRWWWFLQNVRQQERWHTFPLTFNSRFDCVWFPLLKVELHSLSHVLQVGKFNLYFHHKVPYSRFSISYYTDFFAVHRYSNEVLLRRPTTTATNLQSNLSLNICIDKYFNCFWSYNRFRFRNMWSVWT